MQIHVVGLGVAERAELSSNARVLLESLNHNDWVIGSERQLDTLFTFETLPAFEAVNRFVLPTLSELKVWLSERHELGTERVVLLASGDPLFYGIGSWISRYFSHLEIEFYPNVSSIQAACHKLGLSLQKTHVVSVHGRPLSSIRRHLHKNKTLLLLTDSNSHPRAIARECVSAGFERSKITICEKLGYEYETVQSFYASELVGSQKTFDALNVVVVELSKQQGVFPSTPGFRDDLFITDKGNGKGMITKREVRLAILSYLGAEEGEVLWDIGAGCGSVSIELAYWNRSTDIYAIEHHPERFHCLQENREKFGVLQNLKLVEGRAPGSLTDLPMPDRIFIGGSDGALKDLLALAWSKLAVEGVLLLSSVTDATQLEAMTFFNVREAANDACCESVTLQVSRSETLAGSSIRKPSLPVTLWRFEKKLPCSLDGEVGGITLNERKDINE